MKRISILLIFCVFSACTSLMFAQRIVDKHKGDHNETKKGIMDGNLVASVYYNFGEIADWLN